VATSSPPGPPALVVGTYPALALDLPRLARVAVWDAASGSHKQLAGARSVGRRDALELAAPPAPAGRSSTRSPRPSCAPAAPDRELTPAAPPGRAPRCSTCA
jgi:hypothetical protein